MSERILVVDDEQVLRDNVVRYLTRTGHDAQGVRSAEEAIDLLQKEDFALVITDLKMPGMGGEALVRRLASDRPETLVIVITAYASVESAVQTLRLGAQDYLLKPLSLEEVERKVSRVLHMLSLERENVRLRKALHRPNADNIVAASQRMRTVLSVVDRAAQTRSSVVIEGESGTGKELVARALHERSPWRKKGFVAVNLAAQPRDLVDATLFGHEKGAFTGASSSREGVFRAARGGTVFLDEVSELPPEVQVKLLRVLENHEVMPLGADKPIPVDFRLVTATNKPLAQQVELGKFRADLRYRIEVVKIEVPPLRDRIQDIGPLVQRFLTQHAESMGRSVPQVPGATMRALEAYPWPGNVRELSNAIERAVLLCNDGCIDPADLPFTHTSADTKGLKAVLEACERQHIRAAIAACDGDKARAADTLGIHLATLYRRIEKLEKP